MPLKMPTADIKESTIERVLGDKLYDVIWEAIGFEGATDTDGFYSGNEKAIEIFKAIESGDQMELGRIVFEYAAPYINKSAENIAEKQGANFDPIQKPFGDPLAGFPSIRPAA